LIFFSNPDNEDSLLLVLVDEDTTSCWPVVVTANELEGWVVVDVQVVKIKYFTRSSSGIPTIG